MKLILAHEHKLPTGALGLAMAPDGTRAFVTCADGIVYGLDPVSGATAMFSGQHRSYASGCVLLPDGLTLISGGYDGQLLWHDVATGQCWRRLQAHQFWSWQLALSPRGPLLATTTGQYLPGGWKYEPAPETEPSVKVFDTRTGERLFALSHTPPVLSCAFSRDGRHLAAANMLGEVRVWAIEGPDQARLVAQWTSPDFTSWGTIKTHHYCGGIYGLAFAPDDESILGCGMGPMTDPMAGNGKMTWQRWNARSGELLAQIKDGQHGSGLMESIAWHPDGRHFVMAGRQAQGTWNVAIFSAASGERVESLDTKQRVTQARFTADGRLLVLAGAQGQPQRKEGVWPPWGRVQIYRVDLG
jgi:WD40 repeat protein